MLTSAMLWVAVAVYVGPHRSKQCHMKLCTHFCSISPDTCDLAWQSARDSMIISAHVFSDFALLVLVFAVDLTITTTNSEL